MKVEPVWVERKVLAELLEFGVGQEITALHSKKPSDDHVALYAIPPGYALVRVEQVKDAERVQWMSEHWGYAEGMIFFEGFNLGANTTLREAIDEALTAAKGE